MNKDLPTVFVFTKNETPTFDVLKEDVPWHTIPNIGRGSSNSFEFPVISKVGATWKDGTNKTQVLFSDIGKHYTVSKDDTGIVLAGNENASDTKSIDVNNDANIQGAVAASLYKDN